MKEEILASEYFQSDYVHFVSMRMTKVRSTIEIISSDISGCMAVEIIESWFERNTQ